jgi:hypothetical protein
MKKIVITLFAAICSLFASAQTTHEFSINGGGGLSTLNYTLSSGEKTLGFGGEFGLGYTCVFVKTVGIHVGANIALYNSDVTLDDVQIVTENLIDNEGDHFNLHTTLNTYKESQNAMFLNIPVMIQLQTKLRHKFYVMGGVKIGIPLSCKYKVSDATITNEAYYPDYNNWLTDQTFAGYGRFENVNAKGDYEYSISTTLALETGIKWKIGKIPALYTGVYFDYGLNNITQESDQPFVNYTYTNSEPAEFTTNSALPAAADKINVMAVGIKMRMALMK